MFIPLFLSFSLHVLGTKEGQGARARARVKNAAD